MAKQHQSFFLEEWLRNIIVTSSNKDGSVHPSSSYISAEAIIEAWSDLRESLEHQSFRAHHFQALEILVGSQASLHVADPQAKLLISILSLHSLSLPKESYPLFLRLLYVWVRKSRQTLLSVDSAINIVLNLLSVRSLSDNKSSLLLSEGILLLGAFSFQSSASKRSQIMCLELLCKFLEEEYRYLFLSDELASVALAGAGYALSSSLKVCFRRILDNILRIWGQEGGPSGISQGLMLLHLIEWVVSNSLELRSLDKIDILKELLENAEPAHSLYAVVMAAAGVLKAINRFGSSGFVHLKSCAEECIENVAGNLVSRIKGFDRDGNQPGDNLLLHFIALALSRSGSVSHRPPFLVSLALALLTEVFPLQHIYNKVLKLSGGNWTAVLDEVNEHQSSFIFKDAGAITGVFCNYYASANEDDRSRVENLIWDYCQGVYSWHRQTRLMLVARADNLVREIEKIAESAFLMVVVFALGVIKHRFNTTSRETQLQISLRILVSFSCMEYFRRMRLPEYMDTIRAVIVSIQENESACVSFTESIPSYDDLINNHGSSNLPNQEYLWSTDEVQTARIIFYMRVIPTCVDQLPASVFKVVVAPTMFLYMGHPNGKVARYTHSVFVAFMSSGKDPTQDERVLLKEQLVYYYLHRSLEGYPGVTQFEGLASGVVSLVRHLRAGSPAIFCCVYSLVEKATGLCGTISRHDSDLWKNWEGELESSKKLLDLLLRLLKLVDIQVLPTLMKLLAQLIVQLPLNGQNLLLNQLYQQIAESDDVIRKPALVSWLQSLSYLCSQDTEKKTSELIGEILSDRTTSSVSLNRVTARL